MNMESFRSNTQGTGTDRSNNLKKDTKEKLDQELKVTMLRVRPKLSKQLAKIDRGKMKIKSIENIFQKHLENKGPQEYEQKFPIFKGEPKDREGQFY